MKSLLPTFWGEGGALRALQDEVDRVFNDYSKGMPTALKFGEVKFPALDVSETDKALEVSVELPGVAKDDVDVSLVGRSLVVKGEKKSETDRSEKDWHVVERSFGSFRRVVPLGFDADVGKIEATFEDGVLKVRIEKPEEAATNASKIEIKEKLAS